MGSVTANYNLWKPQEANPGSDIEDVNNDFNNNYDEIAEVLTDLNARSVATKGVVQTRYNAGTGLPPGYTYMTYTAFNYGNLILKLEANVKYVLTLSAMIDYTGFAGQAMSFKLVPDSGVLTGALFARRKDQHGSGTGTGITGFGNAHLDATDEVTLGGLDGAANSNTWVDIQGIIECNAKCNVLIYCKYNTGVSGILRNFPMGATYMQVIPIG